MFATAVGEGSVASSLFLSGADPWADSWLGRVFIISGNPLPCSVSGVADSISWSVWICFLDVVSETLPSEDASALPVCVISSLY